MFEPIQGSIKRKEAANPNILFSSRVCFEAGKIIKKLLPEAKNKFKIISFKDGRLKIGVNDSVTTYQIKMKEEEIKKGLEEKAKLKFLKIIYLPRG